MRALDPLELPGDGNEMRRRYDQQRVLPQRVTACGAAGGGVVAAKIRRHRWRLFSPSRWRLEPHAECLPNTGCCSGLPRDISINVQVAPHGIVARKWRADSIDDRFIVALLDEGAEQAIPDNEDTAVVAIETVVVLTVMDAMIRWCDEDTIERSEFADELRVHPILIKQIDQGDDPKDKRRNAC